MTPDGDASTLPALPAQKPSRNVLFFILMTAFLNLAGIGLIAPVLPFIASRYVANPEHLALVNGLLFTAYAFFQFLAVPGLGALSDRLGRRPVMLVCLMGSAVGYLLFGIGGALWVLFLGRIIDGVTGGNIGVIYAYIADVTDSNERTRYYGLIGAVSGFGFVVGPAIGAVLSKIGGPSAPAYFAALVTFLNVVWGYFAMPETLSPDKRGEAIALHQLNPFGQLLRSFALPQLRWLLLASFFAALPFAALQSNLSVLAKDALGWGAADVGGLFTVVGVIGIIVQGGLIRVLVKRLGEARLAIIGTTGLIAGFLLVAQVPNNPTSLYLLIATAVFATGNGLVLPSLTGLISQAVSPREQGRVQGGNQSIQALARVIGPLYGGATYTLIGWSAPYWLGTIMFAMTLGFIVLAIPIINAAKAEREAAKASV